MNKSFLVVGEQKHALPEVSLTGDHAVMEGEHVLSFSLAAVAKPEEEGYQAGLAINCIAVQGLSHLRELQGRTISLGEGQADPMSNELGESVVVEPGKTLELDRLVLRFGEVAEEHIGVELEAVCSDPEDEQDIEVHGHLSARIGKCRERLTL